MACEHRLTGTGTAGEPVKQGLVKDRLHIRRLRPIWVFGQIDEPVQAQGPVKDRPGPISI